MAGGNPYAMTSPRRKIIKFKRWERKNPEKAQARFLRLMWRWEVYLHDWLSKGWDDLDLSGLTAVNIAKLAGINKQREESWIFSPPMTWDDLKPIEDK